MKFIQLNRKRKNHLRHKILCCKVYKILNFWTNKVCVLCVMFGSVRKNDYSCSSQINKQSLCIAFVINISSHRCATKSPPNNFISEQFVHYKFFLQKNSSCPCLLVYCACKCCCIKFEKVDYLCKLVNI